MDINVFSFPQMVESEASVIAEFVAHAPNIKRIFELCESSESEEEESPFCCHYQCQEKKKKKIKENDNEIGRKSKYDEIMEEDDNEQNHDENHGENHNINENQDDDNESFIRRRRPKRKYKFNKNRNIEDPNEYSDKDFRDVFRMSRQTFDLLLDIVANKFPRLGLSPNKKSIIPRQRLLMFLLIAGSDTPGCYRKHNFMLSHGCITDNMSVCIDVLYDGKNDDYEHVYNKQFNNIFLLVSELVINQKMICLPKEEEAKTEALLFSQKARGPFPPIIFCSIDGTHVRVEPPKKKKKTSALRDPRSHYYNRHDELSINVMMVVGASYKIYECVATSKGSVHDSRVFKNSDLYQLFTTYKWRPFENAMIVGDSAYEVSLLLLMIITMVIAHNMTIVTIVSHNLIISP